MKLGSVHHLWDRKGHQRMLVAFHWIFSVHDSCMYPKKSCVKKLLGTPSIFACPLMYSEGGVVEHPRPSACVAAFDEHVDAAASLQGFIFTQNDSLSVMIFHWVWLLFCFAKCNYLNTLLWRRTDAKDDKKGTTLSDWERGREASQASSILRHSSGCGWLVAADWQCLSDSQTDRETGWRVEEKEVSTYNGRNGFTDSIHFHGQKHKQNMISRKSDLKCDTDGYWIAFLLLLCHHKNWPVVKFDINMFWLQNFPALCVFDRHVSLPGNLGHAKISKFPAAPTRPNKKMEPSKLKYLKFTTPQ